MKKISIIICVLSLALPLQVLAAPKDKPRAAEVAKADGDQSSPKNKKWSWKKWLAVGGISVGVVIAAVLLARHIRSRRAAPPAKPAVPAPDSPPATPNLAVTDPELDLPMPPATPTTLSDDPTTLISEVVALQHHEGLLKSMLESAPDAAKARLHKSIALLNPLPEILCASLNSPFAPGTTRPDGSVRKDWRDQNAENKRIIRLHQLKASAHFHLGFILAQQGDLDGAVENLREGSAYKGYKSILKANARGGELISLRTQEAARRTLGHICRRNSQGVWESCWCHDGMTHCESAPAYEPRTI